MDKTIVQSHETPEKQSLFLLIGKQLIHSRVQQKEFPLNLSIYSDASFRSKRFNQLPEDYPAESQSSYAFWIVGPTFQFKKSGRNPYPLYSPIAAEVLSLLKAVKQSIRMAKKHSPKCDHLMITLFGDCKEAMRLMRSGNLIPWQKRFYSFLQKALPFEINYTYLPAHIENRGDDGKRHAWCDLTAGRNNNIDSMSNKTVFIQDLPPKKFYRNVKERDTAKASRRY